MRSAVVVLSLVLGGCGIVFPYESTGSCPQGGQGTCASVRAVYAATNGADHVNAGETTTDQAGAGDGSPQVPGTPGIGNVAGGAGVPAPVGGSAAGPVAVTASVLPVTLAGDGVLPLRSPPEIMRIWIAPWESDAGDLMMSGYVFTELQPRRWQVGSQPVSGSRGLRPVEVPPAAPGPAAPSGSAAGVVTASRTGAAGATPVLAAPPAEASRPVVRTAGTGAQPRVPEGAFWQTEPGTPPVQ